MPMVFSFLNQGFLLNNFILETEQRKTDCISMSSKTEIYAEIINPVFPYQSIVFCKG